MTVTVPRSRNAHRDDRASDSERPGRAVTRRTVPVTVTPSHRQQSRTLARSLEPGPPRGWPAAVRHHCHWHAACIRLSRMAPVAGAALLA